MINKIVLLVVVTLVFSHGVRANSFDTGGTQTIIYKGRPLHVEIPVGAERLIEFGRAIDIAVPSELAGSVQVESIAGTIFMTASEPFSSKRFRFRDRETNEMLLLDVTARRGADLLPVRVLSAEQAMSITESSDRAVERESKVKAPGVVAAVRFAFQQVYSPERLIDPVQGINPANLDNTSVLNHLVPGYKVLAKPLAQWRTIDGLYITAVFIKNTESRTVLLDPRALRAGAGWQSASFRDGVLAPTDNHGDSTTLVVVSDRTWSGSTQWLR